MPRVLVVDDENGVRESLRMLLHGECEVATAESADQALQRIAEAPPDLILLDLVMPGRSGLELLEELRQLDAPPPVVVLTATKTVTTAVEAMKLGASDYVTKPFEVDALRIKVRNLLQHRALEAEVEELKDELEGRSRLGRLLGRSAAMRGVYRTIERIAPSHVSVLITGESGTGKELVARAIHELGARASGPFVAINCAAIPVSLMESELFGHERGAFTDASERRIGRFEQARGGTLFLDEIGELPTSVQAKLLRALQERTIERVGGREPIAVDARFLAATNRDLGRDVGEGRFRADLYYRIHVVSIALPALRERREDVPLLAAAFLERAAKQAGRAPLELARGAETALQRYAWPGNVRELENAIEHAVALSEGKLIEERDLPDAVVSGSRTETLGEAVRSGQLGLEEAVASFEQGLILEALERCDWNQTRAAEQLGITRRVLKLKMDRYGLRER
ncbi:MAG TPA: sigma-54 dependent transcriptional regulator [Myxococcota bacterium]|nr:sigma-54 dependent transcriptional regulator [Myxococcota bacterium]